MTKTGGIPITALPQGQYGVQCLSTGLALNVVPARKISKWYKFRRRY